MARITHILFFISLLLIQPGVIQAQGLEQFYKPIRPIQPTKVEEGKIEVVEVFWYGCPHCYSFEPYVKKWLETKPDDVVFNRMPAIFSDRWMPHGRAYYTAEKLGVLDKVHQPLFDALHHQKRRIYNEDEISTFFVQQGIDAKEFKRIYNSKETDIKIKQAYVMSQKYGLTGVPAVVINGKYMTSGSLAGSYENLLKVIDQLVDKEREESGQ